MRDAERCVIGVVASILAYEATSDEDETITDCARRHPRITAAVLVLLVNHFYQLTPVDPFRALGKLLSHKRDRAELLKRKLLDEIL